MRWILTACLTMLYAGSAAGQKIDYDANVPRSVAKLGYVDVVVLITDLFATEAAKLTEAEILKRLEVFMPQISNSRLPTKGDGSHGFYVTYEGDLQSERNTTTGNLNLSFQVRVHQDTITFAKLLADNDDVLTLAMEFEAGTQGTAVGKDEDFERSVAVANQAPSITKVTPVHRAARATWTAAETIVYSSGDPKAPSGVTLVALPVNDDGLVLPSFIYAGTDVDVAAESCIFAASRVGTEDPCVVCPAGESHYLDQDALKSLGGVVLTSVSGSAQKASVSPMTAETEYAMFAYYLPDGLVRSTCRAVTPAETRTMSEILGEPPAKATDASWNWLGIAAIFWVMRRFQRRYR